jgi:hypothetical protein
MRTDVPGPVTEINAIRAHPHARPPSSDLRGAWGGELEEQCRRALSETRERALAQAERCLQASRDLDEHGVDSWIARALLTYLAT